jgi:hypothetical protein
VSIFLKIEFGLRTAREGRGLLALVGGDPKKTTSKYSGPLPLFLYYPYCALRTRTIQYVKTTSKIGTTESAAALAIARTPAIARTSAIIIKQGRKLKAKMPITPKTPALAGGEQQREYWVLKERQQQQDCQQQQGCKQQQWHKQQATATIRISRNGINSRNESNNGTANTVQGRQQQHAWRPTSAGTL